MKEMQAAKSTACLFACMVALAIFMMAAAGCEGDDDKDRDGISGEASGAGVSTATDARRADITGTAGSWYRPPVGVTWQWQLKGKVNTGYPVEIYDIDLFDSPEPLIESLHASGRKVVCYFSAGSYEDWRLDAAEFAVGDLGSPLDGWEDER